MPGEGTIAHLEKEGDAGHDRRDERKDDRLRGDRLDEEAYTHQHLSDRRKDATYKRTRRVVDRWAVDQLHQPASTSAKRKPSTNSDNELGHMVLLVCPLNGDHKDLSRLTVQGRMRSHRPNNHSELSIRLTSNTNVCFLT
jgi:hypothetical protein